MKKILFLLVIGGALFTASCTKRYDVVQPNQTVYADIKTTDWGTANGGKTDTVLINTPQINSYFRDNGLVAISLTFDGGVTYEPIPYVFDNVNYSFIYGAGGIELYAQSADGTQVITTPPAVTAKITLIPAN
jgi:hypothetical protein